MGKIPWRRKWQPTPIFLPGEFYGHRSLVGYSPWGHKESIQPSDWACILTRPIDKVTRKHALKNTQPVAPQMLKPCERRRVGRGGSAPMCRPHSHCTCPGSWTTHFPDFPLQPLGQENADPLRVPHHPAASSPTQFRSLVWWWWFSH